MATAKTPRAAGPSTKGLKVTSRPAAFRRAGYAFSGEPTVIPLSDLSEEQLEALRTDPMLVCAEVDIEVDAAK